jgi:hypothetical protein
MERHYRHKDEDVRAVLWNGEGSHIGAIAMSGKHQWPAAGRWMSPKEAAVRLGCTTATLRNYVRRGRLRWRPTSMGNLYCEGDLDALAEAWRVLGRGKAAGVRGEGCDVGGEEEGSEHAERGGVGGGEGILTQMDADERGSDGGEGE